MHARTIYARTYIIIVIVVVIGGGSDPWPSTVMITHTHTHTHTSLAAQFRPYEAAPQIAAKCQSPSLIVGEFSGGEKARGERCPGPASRRVKTEGLYADTERDDDDVPRP